MERKGFSVMTQAHTMAPLTSTAVRCESAAAAYVKSGSVCERMSWSSRRIEMKQTLKHRKITKYRGSWEEEDEEVGH